MVENQITDERDYFGSWNTEQVLGCLALASAADGRLLRIQKANLMKVQKKLLFVLVVASTVGCATLTEDAMTPIALSFSDGSSGHCDLENKRGLWPTTVPTTISVRKSDDALKYRCTTKDGREASGSIPSEMGGKIVASAVFLDFGITDAITDKHRRYPPSYVVPIERVESDSAEPAASPAMQQTSPADGEGSPAVEASDPATNH